MFLRTTLRRHRPITLHQKLEWCLPFLVDYSHSMTSLMVEVYTHQVWAQQQSLAAAQPNAVHCTRENTLRWCYTKHLRSNNQIKLITDRKIWVLIWQITYVTLLQSSRLPCILLCASLGIISIRCFIVPHRGGLLHRTLIIRITPTQHLLWAAANGVSLTIFSSSSTSPW